MELYQRNTQELGNGRQISMERLNDIMMRTAQRRQELQEQRSTQQGEPPQNSRPKPTRRPPLPEQTAQLGQAHASSASQQPARSRQPLSPVSGIRGSQGGRYPQNSAYEQRQRKNAIERRSSYAQNAQAPIPETRRLARRQNEAPATGDYYDAYPAMPPADVQEEWEDDAEGIRYGDWESGASTDVSTYSHRDAAATFTVPQHVDWPTARNVPHPHTASPMATRELPSMPGQRLEPRSPLTRHVYTARVPQSQPSPLQAPAQEAPRHHRHTQPLDPRNIADMPPQLAQDGIQSQELGRQMVTQQVQQRLPASSPSLSAKGVCQKCKGAGYLRIDVPYGHPNFGKPIACECKEAEQREKRRQQLLELSDLSAFHNKSFKNFNTRFSGAHPSVQEAFQEAYRFAQQLDGWLVLIGPNGCGKTHLAAAIANQNLNDGAVVLFTVVPDLLAHLRSTFAPTSTEAYDQRFAKMREAELLVLDDLGAHQSSPWASEKLFQLLNYRYNSGYPTVITANRQGLASVDERILSRISDTALVTSVVMNGALDYRRQNPRREPPR